jgi:hypothetical protein
MATLKELEFKGKLAALMLEYDVVLVDNPIWGIVFGSPNQNICLPLKDLAKELNS